MDSTLLRPGKIRKRANKACLACRARKVRCDVSQRGRPCMNCFLDSESCVVVDRASRRCSRKSTEEDGHGDVTVEHASSEHRQRYGSAGSSGEPPDQGDGDRRMEITSDGGSYGPDALPNANSGVPSMNSSSSINKRPAATLRVSSPDRPLQHEPLQHLHSATSARIQSLDWSGEQRTVFGSEVTYSYYAFLEVNNLWRLLPQDASYLEMQGCFRVPKKTILDEFVKQYFLHVHPILPLVNEGDFWETYGSLPPDESKSDKTPLLVFQAMLFAACAYVSRSTVRALGFSDMRATRAAFYRRAKLMFDFEAESSPIAIAQAALLLSSWCPSTKRHSIQTGSSWLGVAIQHAKLAGAHRYRSYYSNHGAESRHTAVVARHSTLKRLWWCTIVSDRMHSLYAQRPLQVTPLHFSRELLCDILTLTDFTDEIERSRVYNSGAKKSLVKIFLQITELAAVLTDLLMEVLPPNEMTLWDETLSQNSRDRMDGCKSRMEKWYETASSRLLTRRDSLESASEYGISELAEVHAHDSVVLYTNFMCLIYQSAMVRLCHYECCRMVAQARRMLVTGTGLPDKVDFVKKRREAQQAAHGVVVCLKTLTQNRLTRWLPLNSMAYVSLPLCLSIIDVKLPPNLGLSLNALQDLHDHVRAYQPQQEMTDWMSNSIRHFLDLAGLDDFDRAAAPPTGSQDWNMGTEIPHEAAEGLHPSFYLRLAVSWMADVESSGLLGPRSHTGTGLLRALGSDLLDRIKSGLDRDTQMKKTSSARLSVPAPTDEDQAMRNRIAVWQAHDQAVSLELGFDASGLALAEADDAAASSGPSPADDETGLTAWKDAADLAFSAQGDAREAELLEAFVFRDQTPGADGIAQDDWPT